MATYDDIATNRHILDIANGIRAVTRTTEEMTIPEMSERLTNIRVVEHREVEVSLGNSNLVISLGMYQQDVKHLFIVTPKTSADAIILQRVKPEIALNYEAATGELTMSYQTPVDSLVTLLVIDLLLANNATNEGFLITQGGGGSIEPYNPNRAYELGETFLYNKGTEEVPNYAIGVTIEAHEAEAYNINHSQVLATQIREEQDEPYIDLLDLARQFNEGFISLGESLGEHISDKTNPHEVTKSQVGLGNVDNTADINKPISSVQQTALDSKVDKILGYGLSKNDYSDDEKAKVEQNAEERHTHTNKDILDNTTASYTATEKTKLSGVENAAQANIIEQIKVNGVAKEVVVKTVDIAVPTRLDDLEDTTDTAPISRASKDASGNTISTTYSKVADIVNDLLSDNTDKPLSAYQGKILKALIDGKESGKAFANIATMVSTLNAASSSIYKVPLTLFIITLDVPDFWITEVMATSIPYTYTTDEALVNAVKSAPLQIGYYKISLSETAKVDLTDYVQKTRTIAGIALDANITKADLQTALDFDTKVDKEVGKGLSTNDYTNTDKAQVTTNTNKLSTIEEGAEVNTVDSVNGYTGVVTITKGDVSLGNADNTSDIDKPVSTAQQAALNLKVDKVAGKALSTNDYDNTEKANVASNTSARHTHSNKATLDTYTQTETDLASAVNLKHTHSNKATLDSLVLVDNLTSTSTTSALSANQGKVLNDNKATKLSIDQWHVPYRDIAGNGEPNASRLATMTSPLPEAILIRDAEGKVTFVGGTSANQGVVKSQLDSAIATTAKLESDNTFTASNNFTHANGLKIGTNVTLKYNSSTSSLEIVVT